MMNVLILSQRINLIILMLIAVFLQQYKKMESNNSEIRQMKEKIAKYEKLQKAWTQERQMMNKNISLMQEQIEKQKLLNAKLLKKSAHKRTCSDQQTFIFNQTNISSYYPIVMVNKNHNWILRANLRSHLDSVRVVHWQGQFLLSAGEDCLLKIWDRDQLKITVRQHLAPIFSICGDNQSIFTAGAQGVVREWSVSSFLHNQRPIYQGQFHQDSIWEMVWNPINRILATSSSDSSIKIIRSSNGQMMQVGTIALDPQIPTSICYLGNQKLISGFVDNKKFSIFQIQKQKKYADFCYQSKQGCNQINKITYWTRNKMIISAHQDKQIRFFDSISGKCIKSMVAHSDAVTSLCYKPNDINTYELISCSHDGTLRIWDIRQFKCVNDIGIHMRKYDESLLCVAHSGNEEMVAVGGANGQIKLLCPQS